MIKALLERIALIWIGCSRQSIWTPTCPFFVSTKEQMADTPFLWNDLAPIVQITATPSDKAFVRSHAQSQPLSLFEKALLFTVHPTSQKREELSWSTGSILTRQRHHSHMRMVTLAFLHHHCDAGARSSSAQSFSSNCEADGDLAQQSVCPNTTDRKLWEATPQT